MQRFRFLPVFVATSLACGALVAHADDDTPAQAAARAALEQQMNQMGSDQGSTNAMTSPAAPAAQPPVEQAPPPVQTPPVVQTPVMQTPPVSAPTPQFSTNVPVTPEQQSAMAPAGMSQTNEPATAQMQSQVQTTLSVPPSVLNTNETEQYPVNPAMAPLPPAQSETQPAAAGMPQSHPVAVPSSGPGGQWPAAAQPNPAAQQLPPSAVNNPGSAINGEPQPPSAAPAYAPVAAPPLPLSQQQKDALQNLLSQYMANQITPAQYQEQRAKIISGQ